MDGSSDETRPWRAKSVLAVASGSVRVPKLRSERIARQRLVSVSGVDSGSRNVARMIPSTKTTSRGRKPRGPKHTRITGGSTGVPILPTASEIVSGDESDTAWKLAVRMLQRWTCQRVNPRFRQGLIN